MILTVSSVRPRRHSFHSQADCRVRLPSPALYAKSAAIGARGPYSRKVRQRPRHQPSTRPTSCAAQELTDGKRQLSREFASRRSRLVPIAFPGRFDPYSSSDTARYCRSDERRYFGVSRVGAEQIGHAVEIKELPGLGRMEIARRPKVLKSHRVGQRSDLAQMNCHRLLGMAEIDIELIPTHGCVRQRFAGPNGDQASGHYGLDPAHGNDRPGGGCGVDGDRLSGLDMWTSASKLDGLRARQDGLDVARVDREKHEPAVEGGHSAGHFVRPSLRMSAKSSGLILRGERTHRL